MQKTNQKRRIFPLFLYICPEPVAIKDQAMANGTLIHQWQFHGSATSRWEFDLTGDGYYTIRSMHSNTTNYYLAVENDSTANGASIVLKSGELTDGMKWDIEGSFRSGYMLIPKAARTSGRVMAVESNSNQTALGLDMKSVTDPWNTETGRWYLRNLDDTIEDDLLNWGLISSDDIVSTDDGFHMVLEPLSNILIQRGITQLYYDNDDGIQQAMQVSLYYDDWYIFAVNTSSIVKYGLVKMREVENDGGDSDTAGVRLPFLSLDVAFLKSCLLNYNVSIGYNLCDHLTVVTSRAADENGDEIIPYDITICSYFGSAFSKGAYLIAEEYVKRMADTHDHLNQIKVPTAYIGLLSDPEDRLVTFISEIDPNDEICVITDGDGYIQLSDPDNLTAEETYVILALYTGDVNFNCFAAEVQYHAQLTEFLYNVNDSLYDSAFRADMETVEGYYNGWADSYHDKTSLIVRIQALIHDEK